MSAAGQTLSPAWTCTYHQLCWGHIGEYFVAQFCKQQSDVTTEISLRRVVELKLKMSPTAIILLLKDLREGSLEFV